MKRFFTLSLAVLTLCTASYARKVTGKVVSGKDKLQGVIVTDGEHFTKTCRNGKFAFEINDDAEFVYIVTPAGYAAPWSSGVPAFYQRAEGCSKFTFDLIGTDDSGDYSIIAVSDPQTKTKKHFEQFAAEPMADLCQCASSLEGAVVGIVLGDICWDSLELLEDYKREIVRTGIPFYPVVGNHDHELAEKGDIRSTAKFRSAMGPENYAFFIGKDVVIALDNIIYDTKKKYKEGYAPHVLTWLSGLMRFLPQDADLYIVQHGTTFRWFNATAPWAVAASDLIDLVRGHKVTFISGHTHISNNMNYGEDIIEHNVASICAAWWDTYYCTDGTPSGYKIYTSKDGNLEWYYKSLGKDKDYQVEFFMPGQSPLHPECVVANVWDWDSSWRVEWFEDGVPMGVLEPVFDLSPNYIEDINTRFAEEKIPRFKQPRLNWHYFAASPSEEAKVVKIVVTGRFGQTWECDVDMSQYADVKKEKMGVDALPHDVSQILKQAGLF